jgi:hypothetical protein
LKKCASNDPFPSERKRLDGGYTPLVSVDEPTIAPFFSFVGTAGNDSSCSFQIELGLD